MSQQSTSCWIRRCKRQYIFLQQFTLVSELHLRSPRPQSPRCLSSGWTRAAGGRWLSQFPRKKGHTRSELSQRKKLTMHALHSLENRARVLFAQTHNAQIVCIIWRQKTLTRIDTPPKALLNRHVYSHFRNKVPWRKKEDDVFHRRPFYARRRSLACIIGVHLPMSGVLGVVIMLQVTGHAGGVPKATLERGRSV